MTRDNHASNDKLWHSPEEKPEEYAQLVSKLLAILQPQGALEEFEANLIIHNAWRAMGVAAFVARRRQQLAGRYDPKEEKLLEQAEKLRKEYEKGFERNLKQFQKWQKKKRSPAVMEERTARPKRNKPSRRTQTQRTAQAAPTQQFRHGPYTIRITWLAGPFTNRWKGY